MNAPQIIDLTYTVAPHFRWKVERDRVERMEDGAAFQVTRFSMAVHGFTHIDSPRHMVPDGPTTDDVRLEQLVGEAKLVDLTGIAPETAITPAHLAPKAAHVERGDIVLLRAAWDTVQRLDTPEFWTASPYMTREACEWLLERQVRAVGYDFPQDYPIRLLLSGEKRGIEEFVTHDVLLRNGVIMIEYLCNLHRIPGDRTPFLALPLKIPDSDGAPARAIALPGARL
ncbi:MAG TPA: cyclase family protein [bacterium]|nr:cyclase family protein [bacterium]